MSRNNERTQGAILRQLQNAIAKLSQFSGYNPPNPEDSIANLQQLEQQLLQSNQDESITKMQYHLAVAEKRKLFFEQEYSLDKTLKYIRANVIASLGMNAKEVKPISAQIRKIRGTAPRSASSVGAAAENVLDRPSRSHRSYGSLTLMFNSLIQSLQAISYSSAVPELEIPQLQTFVQQLTDVCNQTEQKIVEMNRIRYERDAQLKSVSIRMQRIKNYVLTRYGVGSTEYKSFNG